MLPQLRGLSGNRDAPLTLGRRGWDLPAANDGAAHVSFSANLHEEPQGSMDAQGQAAALERLDLSLCGWLGGWIFYRLRHAPICFAWNSREVASANGQAADQSMGLHADVDVVSHSCALDNHTLASERLQDPVTESKPRQAIESWNAQFGLWHIQLHVLGTVERQGQSSMQSYTKIGYVPQQLDDELAGLTVGQKTTQAMTTQHPPLTPSVNISRLPAASERA
ncbi:hypothetical protein NM208_g9132 [Fusarium decemcellulare]|uniref:Uncharacterized protein n=1 Tax=Fusarium decemcellulare TaxID=57161 RepID=A0ACC1S2W0_9HYPO|nr:hypothetical protein NM208_g9132 [Fusarium decemcellulare]